jgi:uncharacterized protein
MSTREACEICSTPLPLDQPDAFICSYGCTYCLSCCVHSLLGICPNCNGELVPRARRGAIALSGAAIQPAAPAVAEVLALHGSGKART